MQKKVYSNDRIKLKVKQKQYNLMFQTLQPQSFRINKTAIPSKRRKLNLNLQINERPFTMEVNRHLSTLTPKENILKTIDDAQIELTNSFRKQMSPYIHQKIRNSLSRNHQRRMFFSRASSYHNNPESELDSSINQNEGLNSLKNTSPMNLKLMKFSSILNRDLKSPFKQKELISESMITNTKQKIDRIIELKREKEEQFQELKKSIQKKCLIKNKNLFRRISILNPSGSIKLPTMETLQWDQEWREDVKKESTRYRNRLMAKHKREMSMKIHVPNSPFFQ